MTIRSGELTLLRSISHAPKTLHQITHVNFSVADVQRSSRTITIYLETLLELGLVTLREDRYAITRRGERYLASLPQVAGSTLICNASNREPFKGTVWPAHVSERVERNKLIPSRGIDA